MANYDPIGADLSIAEKLVQQAVDAFGKLTCIVNNAGKWLRGGIE